MAKSKHTILFVFGLAVLMVVSALAKSEDQLTIVTWGGAYENSQRQAYFEPFTEQTGIRIVVEKYNGGIEQLRQQVNSGQPEWDLVDLTSPDNIRACDEDLLEPLNHGRLSPGVNGETPRTDFYPGALTQCGVAQVIYATVVAYDVRNFPTSRPGSIRDLFDLQRFPGKRGLQKRPIAVLEWALRSYDIPLQQIYSLLSTERGIDLAFDRLDQIRSAIVWWESAEQPVALLGDNKVVMSSGYNGRFFDAAVNQNLPIEILWDAQLYDYSTWGIPRGTENLELAKKFIGFATAPEQLAAQAKYISYGPARRSAMELVWKYEGADLDVRYHLPTYPANFTGAIRRDHQWYAAVQDKLNQRFEAWLSKENQ